MFEIGISGEQNTKKNNVVRNYIIYHNLTNDPIFYETDNN